MVGGSRDPIARQTVGTGHGRGAAGMPGIQNMYVTLQNRQFSTSLEADVHVWIGLVGATLLDKRLFALYALPVTDKRLAQFILLSLVLGIGASRHAECFANVVHGAVKGELAAELSRSERNDSISHLGENGLSFRICPLALELIVKTALIFDTEPPALIGNEGIDLSVRAFVQCQRR